MSSKNRKYCNPCDIPVPISGPQGITESQGTNCISTDPNNGCSVAEGFNTIANGPASHAEGNGTIANGPASHAEGNGTTASGTISHAEGNGTTASGAASHAEGNGTKASGDYSHAEGFLTIANGDSSHAEGEGNTASGRASHVEGGGVDPLGNPAPNLASGSSAHAEGFGTIASGFASHAEGGVLDITVFTGTRALGDFSHAEGEGTTAREQASHAEGRGTTADGVASHAEGQSTTASGDLSHAEGEATTASGHNSHAEGFTTFTSGFASHAEGRSTKAIGDQSHAEGRNTTASGDNSHAEGHNTIASGEDSHSEGFGTTAGAFASHAEGQNTTVNVLHTASHIMGQNGTTRFPFSWHLANGIAVGPSLNSAIIEGATGNLYLDGVVLSPAAADYAEMFETVDKNSIDVGYFVTLDGDKIRKASANDSYILGVVSATPAMIADASDLRWHNLFLKDEWGRTQYHEVVVPEIKDKKEKVIQPAFTKNEPILNPEWDSSKEYIPRLQRPEWVPVGLVGKLLVRDDGTCQVNGYCKSNDEGIATTSTNGYRVMKRTGLNQILIFVFPFQKTVNSTIEQLSQLIKFKEQGYLTEEEFNKQKQILLNS